MERIVPAKDPSPRDWSGSWITEHTTTWIPEQFAKLNNMVGLWDSEAEEWTEGWKVVHVGTRQSEEYILDHERDYKSQRKASDI